MIAVSAVGLTRCRQRRRQQQEELWWNYRGLTGAPSAAAGAAAVTGRRRRQLKRRSAVFARRASGRVGHVGEQEARWRDIRLLACARTRFQCTTSC